MTKPGAVLVAYLKSVAAIVAMTGSNIYASKDFPAGYSVITSPGILIQTRGGAIHYSGKALEPSMQIRCYGLTEKIAENLNGLVFDALHYHKGNGIVNAYLEAMPTPLRDPETGWDYVLSYYQLFLTNP